MKLKTLASLTILGTSPKVSTHVRHEPHGSSGFSSSAKVSHGHLNPKCGFNRPLAQAVRITHQLMLLALCAPAALAQMKLQYGPVQLPPGYPAADAPWPEAEAKGLWPKSPPPAFQQPTTPAPTAPPGQPGEAGVPPPPAPVSETTTTLQTAKAPKNEIGFSGDFFLGQGTVTLPVGYSLKESLGSSAANVQPSASSASRHSDYYGGTISYSRGEQQAWYIDLSYANGKSSGNQTIDTGALGPLNSDFSIDDQWYQVYIRYAFPGLRARGRSAYLRVGGTYVTAKLKDSAVAPAFGTYTQSDDTKDILGNLGFGFSQAFYTRRHLRLGVQIEGEGFYGTRTQTSTENLSLDTGLTFKSKDINNTLYGGIGRLTLKAEYRMGQAGAFRIFADGGVQGRYTKISYPDAGSSDEKLYGPYVKIGLRYAF